MKVVSRMYATPLTWYSNRRVQHGKLHGSKIHHFPRRASRRPSPPKLEVNRHSPEGDKITAARDSGGAECIPSRKTDREIKLRCIGAGKEGRKEVQSKCHLPESNHPPPPPPPPLPPNQPSSFREGVCEGKEGAPNFCPAVYLDCPFRR